MKKFTFQAPFLRKFVEDILQQIKRIDQKRSMRFRKEEIYDSPEDERCSPHPESPHPERGAGGLGQGSTGGRAEKVERGSGTRQITDRY